ncbi:hypothetical protein DAEQUDRAFT_677282 [Daedalea quercina L-15889]|uniref:DDE Tnp4 domain-containing protein n=1 Tax=Daedalea quercina L-15889 TaxID=1314783 RepID=A0A165M2E4_9APHY|nr:hypothetical protein DAEQUDRAFT_677282 [Daedalea quercina L-15889]
MLDRIRNLWQEHLQAISQSRYLQSFYRPPAPSTSDLVARLRYYEKWDLRRWHHWMRMPPYCFDDMLRSIEHNPVFHNNSSRPQMEVERQLAIWIIQAGRYGPGACSIEIAEWTGVSIGTVYNCSRRCMIALMSCHDDAFAPDETQRPGAKKLAEEKSRTPEWGGGILAADGTPVKVFVRPGWYGSDFYGKDKIYAIQLTASHLNNSICTCSNSLSSAHHMGTHPSHP